MDIAIRHPGRMHVLFLYTSVSESQIQEAVLYIPVTFIRIKASMDFYLTNFGTR